ncbi:MAG: UDP-3-O-(3-hydroxymyristoyl)glucosamine N-acyltransferase [Candidatus Kapaibacteriales bacterium]
MELEEPISCKKLAELINGKLVGNPNTMILRLNRIEYAEEGDLTFFVDERYKKYLGSTAASCIIVPLNFDLLDTAKRTYILVENPFFSFFSLLKKFDKYYEKFTSNIHPTAVIGKGTVISSTAYIGPYVVIGENCIVGENSKIFSHVTFYDNVTIGKNTIIHSNVVCYYNTKIGDSCIIHSGAVIGSDGFGFIQNPDGSLLKIPQLGNVIIGDNVEIGANTTIDRAVVGSTIIENGVKLDNLIQIAHNVVIGENSAMASQVGISGSTKIGKRNRFAGQVGIAGHISTADDVTLEAKSGLAKSITESGVFFGSPALKKIEAFRILMATHKLPDLNKKLNQLFKILRDKFNIDL